MRLRELLAPIIDPSNRASTPFVTRESPEPPPPPSVRPQEETTNTIRDEMHHPTAVSNPLGADVLTYEI